MVTKAKIRESLLRERNSLDDSCYYQAETAMAEKIQRSELILEHGYLYGYYPIGRELSLLKGLQWALDAGKRVALPKICEDTMDFYEITSLKEVARGEFGIMEPTQKIPVYWEEAVCLTPGVGFDRTGNRIGHGAGFYDKYFACHSRLKKVGVAYDFQIKEAIPAEKTDIVMDYLLTPSGWKGIEK
ncbi:MAG: 5-formyltetrahydrofolate cyclo-ligase [Lachnospiraceae bacterium]|nr:5-formyltetrahydrofolate cyclo-ligase [Lachnospiraceae bacterium]